MAICQKCGTELLKGANVCDRCGQPIPNTTEPDHSSDQQKTPDRKLLRVLSVFFAIAFIVFCAGVGGRIYLGRVADSTMSEMPPESGYSRSEYRSDVIKEIAASVRGDGRVYLTAMRDLLQKANMADYYDLEINEKTIEEANTFLEESNIAERKKYGIRWYLLQLAGCYIINIWMFGILSIFLLAFWFIEGGRFSNMKDTVSPVAYIIVLGLVIFIAYCLISPTFGEII